MEHVENSSIIVKAVSPGEHNFGSLLYTILIFTKELDSSYVKLKAGLYRSTYYFVIISNLKLSGVVLRQCPNKEISNKLSSV